MIDPESVVDSERPDSDHIRGATEGHNAAFAAFCVRSLPTLLRYYTQMCRQLAISLTFAEDAAQEAFIRAMEWHRTHPEERVSLGWLVRVGQNVLKDWARHDRRAHTTDDFSRVASPSSVDGIDEDLWHAIERLKSDERTVLELLLVEELPIREIATRLVISQDATYKRYQRALVHLRELMKTNSPDG